VYAALPNPASAHSAHEKGYHEQGLVDFEAPSWFASEALATPRVQTVSFFYRNPAHGKF
jgi:hypothetical protein